MSSPISGQTLKRWAWRNHGDHWHDEFVSTSDDSADGLPLVSSSTARHPQQHIAFVALCSTRPVMRPWHDAAAPSWTSPAALVNAGYAEPVVLVNDTYPPTRLPWIATTRPVDAADAGTPFFRDHPTEAGGRGTARTMLTASLSGWGIRLVARPAMQPRLHNGSVWPADNALIASGLARQGQGELGLRIWDGMFAAGLPEFDLNRMPELMQASREPGGRSAIRSPAARALGSRIGVSACCNASAWRFNAA